MAELKAKKLNMSQVFTEDGRVMPVTILEVAADQEVKLTDFAPGGVVNVTGKSKGRGFAGAMKRHGFHGAPASHGHDHPRAVGSIGQMFPQHVRPGLRMAGRMGTNRATMKNSIVVAVDLEKNLLFVKGSVPGHRGTKVLVVTTGKKKELAKLAKFSRDKNE